MGNLNEYLVINSCLCVETLRTKYKDSYRKRQVYDSMCIYVRIKTIQVK